MAVRINGTPEYNATNKTVKVALYADAKADVTDNMEVEGLLPGYALVAGSTCLCANKDFGMLKTDGTWQW